MTRVLAENYSNDMYRGVTGSLAVLTGLASLIQRCRSVMQVQLGECVLDTTRGVPLREFMEGLITASQFAVASRAALTGLLGSEGELVSFTVGQTAHVGTYTAVIKTIYSNELVTVNG